MHWFGPNIGAAAMADPEDEIDVPAGTTCAWCHEPITQGESGYALPVFGSDLMGFSLAFYHVECNVRMVVGSLGHQEGTCSCVLGERGREDPEWMTKRQAALMAYGYMLGRAALEQAMKP